MQLGNFCAIDEKKTTTTNLVYFLVINLEMLFVLCKNHWSRVSFRFNRFYSCSKCKSLFNQCQIRLEDFLSLSLFSLYLIYFLKWIHIIVNESIIIKSSRVHEMTSDIRLDQNEVYVIYTITRRFVNIINGFFRTVKIYLW